MDNGDIKLEGEDYLFLIHIDNRNLRYVKSAKRINPHYARDPFLRMI